MASNEDGFISDDSAFAEEDGYAPEASEFADDGYEPVAKELSIEELLDGAGDDVHAFGYLDPDLGPPNVGVGADSEFGFLDAGMGPVFDDVGVEHLTLAADGTYGLGEFGADYAYNPKSKVSAAGQRAIYDMGNTLAARNGGKRQTLTAALNALIASGGISAQDANQAALEHGQHGGFNLGAAIGDLGNAGKSLAEGAVKAAGAVAKGVGQEIETGVNTVEHEATIAATTVGKVGTDVVHGKFGAVVSDVTAGAKAAAAVAAAGVKDELAHAKATAASVAQDVINGVAGAEKSLVAMVSQFSPEDLIEMIEKDFDNLRGIFDRLIGGSFALDHGVDRGQPKVDPNSLDLSHYQIPRTGAVADLFPTQYRGQLMSWSDARKNAGTIVWYLAGLALVDALHLRNKMLAMFGIKAADGRDFGFAPLALLGSAPQVIAILVAILTIAMIIIKMVAGPNTVAAKAAKDAARAFCSLNPNDPKCLPGGAMYYPPDLPPPPPPVLPPPPPPFLGGVSGHSSSGVTFAVVAVGAILLILFLKSQEE